MIELRPGHSPPHVTIAAFTLDGSHQMYSVAFARMQPSASALLRELAFESFMMMWPTIFSFELRKFIPARALDIGDLIRFELLTGGHTSYESGSSCQLER